MVKNMKKWGCIAFVLCVLAGCASQKQISYLQNVPDDYRQKITQDYDLKIHPDDLLSIMVNSKDPELAQMFNLPMVSYQIANSDMQGDRIEYWAIWWIKRGTSTSRSWELSRYKG